MISIAAAAVAVQAQCIDHAEGKTALKFKNETGYELTFFIDEYEKVTVPSGGLSGEFETEPGEHILRARATINGEYFWVFMGNEVPEGKVCTWTIENPHPARKGRAGKYRSALP
jgi:hypothetical protein